MRLASASPGHAALHALDLGLELLDDGVALLEVLVEAVPLGDELLLPLPEALLLDLDLLGKALAESLFLLLELGVVQLPGAGLAKLPCLHLLCAVCLVVVLLGGVDEVKHVSSDQDSTELLEVTVLLVVHLNHTPRVATTADLAAFGSLNLGVGADDGKGNLGHDLVVLRDRLFVVQFIAGALEDVNVVVVNVGENLVKLAMNTYEAME